MDVNAASVFLAGTILYSLGILVILTIVVVCNNIIHRYWKTFGWKFFPTWIEETVTFQQETNKIPPTLDGSAEKQKNNS